MSATKSVKLSTRLQTVYDLCMDGQPLWDIGCDHGLLGQRGLLDKKFSDVYFVEPSKLAMQSLKQNFADLSVANFLEQKGQDLDWKNIAGNVVMAGMGARTMVEILEKSLTQPGKRNFILSPQWSVPRLLEFFDSQKLKSIPQIIVREGHRKRVIFGPLALSE